jgi:hypothetical protein
VHVIAVVLNVVKTPFIRFLCAWFPLGHTHPQTSSCIPLYAEGCETEGKSTKAAISKSLEVNIPGFHHGLMMGRVSGTWPKTLEHWFETHKTLGNSAGISKM